MEPRRWQRVKQVFQQALQRAPDDRDAFLREACPDDTPLRYEVQSLLISHTRADSFIEKPVAEELCDLSSNADGADSTPADTEALRDELRGLSPDYELLKPCGKGAFGHVWIVRDRAGAYRAMKVVDLGRLQNIDVPHRELQALEHYCRNVPVHPNLIQIFHIGMDRGRLYYTMELADNLRSRSPVRNVLPDDYEAMTLQGVLLQGRVSTDVAVEIALRLLRGLECLHEAQLVHRDIKPANVIFVNRHVKLADLTLVSLKRSQMSRVGTPRYMPPDERMDTTADTYALGKMLHEMISGGDMSTFPHLPQSEQIGSSRLDLEKVDAFLCRACSNNARDRFASAAEMRQSLYDCRLLLFDSPLLELAEREFQPTDAPLNELHRAVEQMKTSTSQSAEDTQAVWGVIDRVLRALPWLVVFVLGYFLIDRLTR